MSTSTAIRPDASNAADNTAALPVFAAEDLGKLLLRGTIGVLMLLHGLAKMADGPGDVMVYVGEVAAPLLLIAGCWTQPAALALAVSRVVAIVLTPAEQVFALGAQGGWAVELQVLYLCGALAIVFLGAGRISVGGLGGRWN